MTGKFKVNKTLWSDGAECVGLAADYVADGKNTVTILAKNKEDGKLKYPGLYEIDGDDIREYPTKKFGAMPAQHFVPVAALTKISATTYFGGA